MHILSEKKLFVLYSLLNDWNYFRNKYCHLPFLYCQINIVIYLPLFAVPYFPFWYFLHNPDIKKQKLGCKWACKKKKINYHIKGLYKTTCYKAKPNFSQFFFSQWELHKCFISFLIKAFSNFENLTRFHWQDFLVYQNEKKKLKMLIEIFWQKLLVSDIILAFLDDLKPKRFFVGQPWWPT